MYLHSSNIIALAATAAAAAARKCCAGAVLIESLYSRSGYTIVTSYLFRSLAGSVLAQSTISR